MCEKKTRALASEAARLLFLPLLPFPSSSKNALKKVKMRERKSDFHPFYFFSLIFVKKENFMFVKNKPLFSTYFFARAKNGRFLTRAPTPPPALLRKWQFLVNRKKMRENVTLFLTNK
jgi:hypothetical protein